MKHLLTTRVLVLSLMVLAASLLVTVVWMGSPNSISTAPGNKTASASGATILIPHYTQHVTDRLQTDIVGSGFATPGAVFVEVVQGGGEPNVAAAGLTPSVSGAIQGKTDIRFKLPVGIYTVIATDTAGNVATHPLVITAAAK